MTIEAILTVIGIIVSVLLFFLGIVVAAIGSLLSQQLKSVLSSLKRIRPLELKVARIMERLGMDQGEDDSDVLPLNEDTA